MEEDLYGQREFEQDNLIQRPDCPDCHRMLSVKLDSAHKRVDWVCATPNCPRSVQKTRLQRPSTRMDFCPSCRHMLKAEEGANKQLVLKCSSKDCTYVGPAKTSIVYNHNLRKVTEEAQINWSDMTLDKTLQREYGSYCRNPLCRTREERMDEETFTVTSGTTTELLLFQIQSTNGVESYAICAECGFHWSLHVLND